MLIYHLALKRNTILYGINNCKLLYVQGIFSVGSPSVAFPVRSG